MMTTGKFIIRSLAWYLRQHLALLAGSALTAMVITGALIIGDSVRYSLSSLASGRLGSVRFFVSTGGRLLRDTLACDLSAKLQSPASAVLMLQGIGINQENNSRTGQVQVTGIDSVFWQFAEKGLSSPATGEVIISKNLASELALDTGSMLLLRIEKAGVIPVGVPLSPERQPSVSLRLRIAAIAGEKNLGRFSLKSNQMAPFLAFVDRNTLARAMEITGLCNGILIGEKTRGSISTEDIARQIHDSWKLQDAGLKIRDVNRNCAYALVSDRIFIDPVIVRKIDSLKIPNKKVLSYLANSIRTSKDTTPYSFVSALDEGLLPVSLHPHEAIVNQWLADDLHLSTGDTVQMDYYAIGSFRQLKEKTAPFVIKGIIPDRNDYAGPDLIPEIPGISDAGSCHDWNAGVPVDLKRIRDKDEKYWDDYRGTSKMLIRLEDGQSLWNNSFGNITSLQCSADTFQAEDTASGLLSELKPGDLGISVFSVYNEGMAAVAHAVDFGELFLGLSFFIILAAVVLLLLIYSLAVSSRSVETALLSGVGLNRKLLIRIRVTESAVVIIIGSMLGAIAGILYNELLVKALNTVWQEAVQTDMIKVHIRWSALITGAGSGFILAFATVLILTHRKLKEQIAGSLKGAVEPLPRLHIQRMQRIRLVMLSTLVLSILLLLWSLFSKAYENAGLFLSAGALFLTGCIAGILWFLEKIQYAGDTRNNNIIRLGFRNAGRNHRRSLNVILLMAIGVYSIILTGAYRKNYAGTDTDKHSGTGGFQFWAETTLPIVKDLNDPVVQREYFGEDDSITGKCEFIQFLVLDGDDASCLNLNQVSRPRILGINPGVFNNAFSFISLLPGINKDNPWASLTFVADSNTIPVFADQSVLQYSLQKSLGDTLIYLSEAGEKLKFVLAGGLDNSIFQGNILIDEKALQHHFPSLGGSRAMLIRTSSENAISSKEILQNSLMDYGLSIVPTGNRLAAFHTVENTYLSVFMILGGLGLILGTVGLAIVLYRNRLERQHELAILAALGFRRKHLIRLILFENIFLFLAGLLAGILSAVISVIPSWLSPGFETQTGAIAIIILLVLMSGLFWIIIPARRSAARVSMDALRNE